MAGDCPHHSQLQDTLKHCHDQTAILAASRDSYLHFIDELKNDLETLSCQVRMVQQQFSINEDDSGTSDGAVSTTVTTAAHTICGCNFMDHHGSGGDNLHGTKFKSRHAATISTTTITHAKPAPPPLSHTIIGDFIIPGKDSQDRLLSQALEEMVKQSVDDTATSEVDENNENLKCQMEKMQNEMYEKECRIKQLNAMLTRLTHIRVESQQSEILQQKEAEIAKISSQLEQALRRNETMTQELERVQKNERFLQSETRKLSEEMCDFQRKNADLTTQIHRLSALLKTQEQHRLELSEKYECLESNYEEQGKQLRTAHLQMTHLQDRFSLMEKRTSEHNMERDLLREEVLCLKEKEAVLLGKQKAFQEQLYKIQKELYTAHDVIKEQQTILQRNDCAHAEAIKRLQETGNDTKRQFNALVEDYNRLHEEYEKLNEIRRQNEKVIESFRKWKDAQLKSDEATRNSFKQYEEHIKLLLEEKQRFLEKYRQLHCDYNILQAEVERLRCSAYNLHSPTGANTSDNSISNRIELIRRTSRRVSERSSSLKDNSSGDPLHPRRYQQQ